MWRNFCWQEWRECSIISEVVSRGVRPQTGFYEVLCVTLGCAGVISLSAYILLFSVCLFSAAYLRYASGHHRAGNFPSFRQKHFFFLSFHFCCCQTQSRFPVPTKMELALTIWGGGTNQSSFFSTCNNNIIRPRPGCFRCGGKPTAPFRPPIILNSNPVVFSFVFFSIFLPKKERKGVMTASAGWTRATPNGLF